MGKTFISLTLFAFAYLCGLKANAVPWKATPTNIEYKSIETFFDEPATPADDEGQHELIKNNEFISASLSWCFGNHAIPLQFSPHKEHLKFLFIETPKRPPKV